MSDILNDFADMSRESRTEEGDWQGDGFGISWWDGGKWNVTKSLNPIWEERDRFSDVPGTNLLIAHARSASFDKHKGDIGHNEPYIKGKYAFVFNGFLKGVRLKRKVPGEIGAQKIWNLVKENLEEKGPEESLGKVVEFLSKNTKNIRGLNIGLSDGENIYAISAAHSHDDYFTLHKKEEDPSIICSAPIGNYEFEKVPEREIIAL